jgi:cofilin
MVNLPHIIALTWKSTGVTVNDECLNVYQDLKLKKKWKYIVYKLSDDNKSIEIEKLVEQGDYDQFIADLPKDDCRYAVYDFEYDTNGEGIRNKICFYVW